MISIDRLQIHEAYIWQTWALRLSELWEVNYETIEPGAIYDYASFIIGYDDLKYCVINKVDFETFAEWYDGCLYDKKKQNLKNYVNYGWIS